MCVCTFTHNHYFHTVHIVLSLYTHIVNHTRTHAHTHRHTHTQPSLLSLGVSHAPLSQTHMCTPPSHTHTTTTISISMILTQPSLTYSQPHNTHTHTVLSYTQYYLSHRQIYLSSPSNPANKSTYFSHAHVLICPHTSHSDAMDILSVPEPSHLSSSV